MLQAMNTGHDGSITTVHSNSPRDTLSRIETMTLMAGMDLPVRVIREQMASALDMIVHLTRLRDGTRRVTHVSEVMGMEGDVVVLQDIYMFDFGPGIDEDGPVPRRPQEHRHPPVVLGAARRLRHRARAVAVRQDDARRATVRVCGERARGDPRGHGGQPGEDRLRAAGRGRSARARRSRSSSCRATTAGRSSVASATSCRTRRADRRRRGRGVRAQGATRPSPRPRSCSAWSASPVASPTGPGCCRAPRTRSSRPTCRCGRRRRCSSTSPACSWSACSVCSCCPSRWRSGSSLVAGVAAGRSCCTVAGAQAPPRVPGAAARHAQPLVRLDAGRVLVRAGPRVGGQRGDATHPARAAAGVHRIAPRPPDRGRARGLGAAA